MARGKPKRTPNQLPKRAGDSDRISRQPKQSPMDAPFHYNEPLPFPMDTRSMLREYANSILYISGIPSGTPTSDKLSALPFNAIKASTACISGSSPTGGRSTTVVASLKPSRFPEFQRVYPMENRTSPTCSQTLMAKSTFVSASPSI